jgi:hypothetical protein
VITGIRTGLLWLGAVVGVPMLFAVFLWASYHIGLFRGVLSYSALQIYWLIGYGVSLGIGSTLVTVATPPPLLVRITASILYTGLMGIALFWVALFVSCASGDCI